MAERRPEVRSIEPPGLLSKLWGKTLNAFGVPNDFQEDSTSWADAVRNSANYISPYNVGHGGNLEPQVPQAATDFVDANKGMMERMGRSEPEPLDGLMAFGLSSGVGGLGRRAENYLDKRAARNADANADVSLDPIEVVQSKPSMALANGDEKAGAALGAFGESSQPTMYRGVRMADKPGPISPDSPYYWMTSDPNLASDYALGEKVRLHYQSPAVIPSVTDFKNPMTVDAQGQHWMNVPQADGSTRSTDGLAFDALKRGHDGLIVNNVNDAPYDGMPAHISTVSAALKPNTVRSATTGETLFSNGDERAALAAGVGVQPIRAYHGAKTPYDGDLYDPKKSQYKAFFAAEDPEYASKFARNYDGSRVYPVDISPDAKLFDYSNSAHTDKLIAAYEKNPALLANSYLTSPDSIKNWMRSGDAGILEDAGVQKWLKKSGFDGWKFEDTAGLGDNRTSYGMLRPGHVRSATTGETLFSNANEKIGAFTAAASNLPMDQASRMTRAADGGYHINEPVYHETGAKNKIKEFKPGFGTSVWFTTDKSTLGDNGAAGTGQVIEAFLKHKKLAGWDEYDKYNTDQLIQMGYDGARLDKDIVMFSPKGIRDINAAFDPSKSESTDLLAANANPFGAASDFLIPPLAPEDEEFGAFGDVPKR